MLTFNKKDWAGLQKAIARNPDVVQREAKNLFVRVGSYIDRSLATSPWKVGGGGGGVPYASGELFRNARNKEFKANSMRIYTNTNVVPYALFVHEGTSRMQARPYYDVAAENTEPQQNDAINTFLDAVTNQLAK